MGNPQAVWGLCDWLRAPIEIIDDQGAAIWWGYIAEVTVTTGAIELGLSVDTMANRIAVQYQDPGSGTQVQARTGWLEDADSITEYGRFERIASINGSVGMAAGLRKQLLQSLRVPVPMIRHTGRAGELTATVRCRGWWDSLAWQYVQNDALTGATTTAQIETILSNPEASEVFRERANTFRRKSLWK